MNPITRLTLTLFCLCAFTSCNKFDWATQTDYSIQNYSIQTSTQTKQPQSDSPITPQLRAELAAKENDDDTIPLHQDRTPPSESVFAEPTYHPETESRNAEEVETTKLEQLTAPTQIPEQNQVQDDSLPAKKKSAETPQNQRACIDLNEANASDLMTLPGVGARRAQDILNLRNKRPFKRKSDIKRVKGIGKKTYQKIADQLCDI